jgi:hypothetical protein
MKKETNIKKFSNENNAIDWMQMKNRSCEKAGNKKDVYCLVDGPDDNYAVVDLRTAIELGNGYKINY